MMADMTPPTMYHCVNGSKPRRTRDAQTLALTTHFVSLLMWYCKRAGREDASSLGDGEDGEDEWEARPIATVASRAAAVPRVQFFGRARSAATRTGNVSRTRVPGRCGPRRRSEDGIGPQNSATQLSN